MKYIVPFLISTLITYALTPLVIRFAIRYKLVDNPKIRKHPASTHKGAVPRAGGLSLYLGIISTMLIFLRHSTLIWGVLISSTILVITGLADDKKDVNPYVRLGINSIVSLIVIFAGAGIPYITNPLHHGVLRLDTWSMSFSFFGHHTVLIWSVLVAFLWIMWIMNIIGWSGGVDGQLPGFVAISACVLGFLSLRFSIQDQSQTYVTLLAFIVSGAFFGFIPWNFFPQKIMPGYGGKTLAGFFLALLGILSYGKLGTALLVLGIPTIDAAYTLFRRLKTGKSPVWADRGHLHHLLLNIGWGKRRIALFYWLVSAILGIIALSITSKQKMFILLVVAIVMSGFLLWLDAFSQQTKSRKV